MSTPRVRDFHEDDLDQVVRIWEESRSLERRAVYGLAEVLGALRDEGAAVVAAVGGGGVGGGGGGGGGGRGGGGVWGPVGARGRGGAARRRPGMGGPTGSCERLARAGPWERHADGAREAAHGRGRASSLRAARRGRDRRDGLA